MTKTQIKKDLQAFVADESEEKRRRLTGKTRKTRKTRKIVITAPMVAKAMQMRRSEAYELCKGCNYEKRGRSRFYYIDDVAERLAKRMMV